MSALITITERRIGQKTLPAISARELYEGLGLKRSFSNWSLTLVENGDWLEHKDFEIMNAEVHNATLGRPPEKDYAFSLEMAEHVAMMTRTVTGREVRNYFRQARDERDALVTAQQSPMLPTFHNPQTKMFIDALIRIDYLEAEHAAHKDMLIANQAETIKAQEMALTALRGQQWLTIRQYVYIHDLAHQMPLSTQRAYAKHVGQYSQEHGIPMYKAATADVVWPDERTYHVQAIHDTLGPWLQRQNGQVDTTVFLMPPTQGV